MIVENFGMAEFVSKWTFFMVNAGIMWKSRTIMWKTHLILLNVNKEPAQILSHDFRPETPCGTLNIVGLGANLSGKTET